MAHQQHWTTCAGGPLFFVSASANIIPHDGGSLAFLHSRLEVCSSLPARPHLYLLSYNNPWGIRVGCCTEKILKIQANGSQALAPRSKGCNYLRAMGTIFGKSRALIKHVGRSKVYQVLHGNRWLFGNRTVRVRHQCSVQFVRNSFPLLLYNTGETFPICIPNNKPLVLSNAVLREAGSLPSAILLHLPSYTTYCNSNCTSSCNPTLHR